MRNFYILLYILLLVFPSTAFSQIRTSLNDEQFYKGLKVAETKRQIRTINIPSLNVDNLLAEDLNDSGPPRFGKAIATNFQIEDGTWEEVAGGRVWSLSINSPNALSLNLQVEDLELSRGVEVYFISKNKRVIIGPITSENFQQSTLSTDIIPGDEILIQLYEPDYTEKSSKLRISKVVYGYKSIPGYIGFGDSAPCHIDVNCSEGENWQDQSNSVALLILDGERFCSGSILNNACQDLTPNLLTAFHCVDIGPGADFQNGIISQAEQDNLANWVFRFQYKSPTCDGDDPTIFYSFSGATFRAAWVNTDFALMELNNRPTPNTGIQYAGWSRSANAPTSTVGIHHPRGDVMKISIDEDPAVSVAWAGGQPNTHWRSVFEHGTVEHGSSGSPLFDQNRRVVGQLHGDQNNQCASIDNNQCFCNQRIGEYGRFDISWIGGGTPATQLSVWLTNDPNVTETNTISIPTVGGPSLVCNGSAQFNLQNPLPGIPVTWNVYPTNLFIDSTSGTGTTANLQTVTGTGGNAVINFTYSTPFCQNQTFQRFFDIGIPPVPPITPPGPYTVEPNTTIQVVVPDIADIDWGFSGNSNHYNYSLSQGNLQCNFTPTALGNFQIKARANYGCGFSDYSVVDVICEYNRPDLTIQNLNVSTSFNSITFNYDLVNLGNVTANSPLVNYYWSNNTTYEPGTDPLIGGSTTANIPPSGSVSVSKTFRVSSSQNYVLVYADPYDDILESNENNNLFWHFGIVPEFTGPSAETFSAYPVPFADELTVNFILSDTENNEAEINDVTQKEIYLVDYKTATIVFQKKTQNKSLTIDARKIPAGQYVLLVRGEITESMLVIKK
jgi:lysyl endopeptidase